MTEAESALVMAEDARNRAQLVSRLARTNDGQNLALAAMLSSDLPASVSLLQRALDQAPTDPLVLWNVAQGCDRSGLSANKKCARLRYQALAQLSELDADNVDVHLSLAADHWRAGDEVEARASLNRAVSGSRYSAYWPDTIEMVLRGQQTVGDPASFAHQAGLAFGVAPLPDYGAWLRLCRELGQADVAVAEQCLGLAQRGAVESREEIGQGVYRALEIEMLILGGRQQQADRRRQEKEAVDKMRMAFYQALTQQHGDWEQFRVHL